MKKLTEKYSPWDWENFLKMIEHWMDQSADKYDSVEAFSVQAKDIANKMRYIAMLARRIRKHDYMEENKLFMNKNEFCGPIWRADQRLQEDIDHLFQYLAKNLQGFWD